jgi:hypothetical protein
MISQGWEASIRQMVEESSHEPKESGQQKVLLNWRARLQLEPHVLKPFQIDEIVREVRKRLTSVSQHSGSGSLPRY